MRVFRIAHLARADIEQIRATSLERWGAEACDRYTRLLAAALHLIEQDPFDRLTPAQPMLGEHVRSLHLQRVRSRVKDPVHVVLYRPSDQIIEVVRVLHERMDPSIHVDEMELRKSKRR